MEKPLLIFDGDCGFCRRWIDRWKRLTGDSVDYAPYQEVGSRFPQINTAQFEEAVVLVGVDGAVTVGAEAVFGVLKGTRWGWLNSAYFNVPGVAPATRAAYRVVARNRMFFSRFS